MRVASLMLACGLTAFAGSAPQAPPPHADLVVFAAADHQLAFGEIGPMFEQASGQKVAISFGSSGSLATQIENGAPADIFFSADEGYIRSLVQKGLLDGTSAKTYAEGRLMLATRRASGIRLGTLQDLRRPAVVRFAIANPEHAPYGRAAREALRSAGLWDTLAPRIVMGENIRQAAQYLITGAVEAALLSRSLARDTSLLAVDVDPQLHRPILQAAAVVRGSARASTARAFLDFVATGPGWAVMERHGFVTPHAL
jgi:molybdate transport system substrate-binding protein